MCENPLHITSSWENPSRKKASSRNKRSKGKIRQTYSSSQAGCPFGLPNSMVPREQHPCGKPTSPLIWFNKDIFLISTVSYEIRFSISFPRSSERERNISNIQPKISWNKFFIFVLHAAGGVKEKHHKSGNPVKWKWEQVNLWATATQKCPHFFVIYSAFCWFFLPVFV